jgi:hypothetical protein
MKICSIIASTAKYHDTRCQAVLDTWGKDVDRLFIATDGSTHDVYRHCSDKTDFYSQVEKMVRAIEWVISEPICDWYTLGCEDVYINVRNLRVLCENLDPAVPMAWGHLANSWEVDRDLHYLSGGAQTLVSRQTLERFPSYLRYNEYSGCKTALQDVSFGYVWRYAHVEMVDHPMFFPDSCAKDGFITSHHQTPEQIRSLHDFYTHTD